MSQLTLHFTFSSTFSRSCFLGHSYNCLNHFHGMSQIFDFEDFEIIKGPSKVHRRSIEGLLKVYRRSIEGISKVYRRSIEGLLKVYRRSIEGLSKVYRRSIKGLSKVYWRSINGPSMVHRRSIEGLSKVYRSSTKGLSKVYQRSIKGLLKVYWSLRCWGLRFQSLWLQRLRFQSSYSLFTIVSNWSFFTWNWAWSPRKAIIKVWELPNGSIKNRTCFISQHQQGPLHGSIWILKPEGSNAEFFFSHLPALWLNYSSMTGE